MSRIFSQSFKLIGVKERETFEIPSHLDPYGSPFVLNAFFSKLHGEQILGYDSTPGVTAANFLYQHSDNKRFSYSSK